jgi:hypothetical protein
MPCIQITCLVDLCTESPTVWFCFWLLLYADRHRSILGAAGHIILTPANQLMLMGLKIGSLSNRGSKQRPFDYWLTSLPTVLPGPTTVCIDVVVSKGKNSDMGYPEVQPRYVRSAPWSLISPHRSCWGFCWFFLALQLHLFVCVSCLRSVKISQWEWTKGLSQTLVCLRARMR